MQATVRSLDEGKTFCIPVDSLQEWSEKVHTVPARVCDLLTYLFLSYNKIANICVQSCLAKVIIMVWSELRLFRFLNSG